MPKKKDEIDYSLINKAPDAGTAVSPTLLDEKEDFADDGSRRRKSAADEGMIILNPLGRREDYSYPVQNLSSDTDAHEELTDTEREAVEKIKAAEVRETRALTPDDLEYIELNKNSDKYYESLENEFGIFPAMLKTFDDGDFTFELKKRYMLKAIDEVWIKQIEDHLTPLDTIIRSPGRFIEQNEQLLPIELSKNITTRSIQHLGQHTNLISKVEGDMITPSKILNVFNDETMLTYENKFINTLINRLYVFIAKRYQAAVKSGRDEKCTMLDFGGRFISGKIKGKVKFAVEISEEPEENVQLKNYYFTTDLWHRVEKLYKIVQNYMSSDFVTQMGKAYIRPPVMRTNAILRNKNMRQCLELWEFIESYENIGYEMLIQENAEDINEKYKKQLYNDAVLRFLLFRYNVKNDFNDEEMLSTASTDLPLSPKLISQIKPFDANDYNVFDPVYQKTVASGNSAKDGRASAAADKETENAIDLVLYADEIYGEYIKYEEERIRIEEEKRRAEEERKRKEEEKRREEERRRQEEEERQRLLAEQKEEEERKAREAAEKAAIDAAKAEKERAKREAEEAARLAEEAKKKAAEEAERQARRQVNKSISRKKKKKISTAARNKAEKEGVKLSKTFDYKEYTEFLKKQ
ncbi:MAG: hypothetical protein IJQ53_03345 [Clostridia bacterium]|nr:hypothetical protein [Clostridia bacterium]